MDWFRGRHAWPKLFRLIEQLPAHSRYKAALANDDDLAEHLADLPRSDEFGFAGWTAEVALLSLIVDWLQAVHSATLAPHVKKPPKVKPLPRPTTALERLERRRSHERGRALLRHLFPDDSSA